MKPISDNKNHYINGDGAPDWLLHGIHVVADEKLNVQMLFDLAEEQLAASASQSKRGESQ